jgi:hypothetical protein
MHAITMNIKLKLHCNVYIKLYTLAEIWTQNVLLTRQSQRPVCHATRASFMKVAWQHIFRENEELEMNFKASMRRCIIEIIQLEVE